MHFRKQNETNNKMSSKTKLTRKESATSHFLYLICDIIIYKHSSKLQILNNYARIHATLVIESIKWGYPNARKTFWKCPHAHAYTHAGTQHTRARTQNNTYTFANAVLQIGTITRHLRTKQLIHMILILVPGFSETVIPSLSFGANSQIHLPV